MPANRVIETQTPSGSQAKDERGSELLALRSRLVDRAVGGGSMELDAGLAIASGQDHPATPHDRHRYTGHPLAPDLVPHVAVDRSERRLLRGYRHRDLDQGGGDQPGRVPRRAPPHAT